MIIITNIDFELWPSPPRLFGGLEPLSSLRRVAIAKGLSSKSAPATLREPEADKVALDPVCQTLRGLSRRVLFVKTVDDARPGGNDFSATA